MRMKVSCIIPTYNRREMISDAIISATNQNGYEVEVVVVDDGSTDGTSGFIEDHFDAVVFVTQSNKGPGAARNKGVEASCGDVIMFLDSDDTWLPGHVKSLMDVLSSGYEFAYGTTLTKDRIQNNEFLIPEDGNGAGGDCIEFLSRWCSMVPSSVALTRDAFDRAGGFESGNLGEDWAFFMRLAFLYDFAFVGPEPITIRNLHEGSLCYLPGSDAIQSAIRNVGNIIKKSEKNGSKLSIRYEQLEEWAITNGRNWSTVQDWYCAMKKEGMV